MFGEFDLIDKINPIFKSLVADGCLGIGDDCAVMPMDDGHFQIITTDMLVEDVHFLRDAISAEELGGKSLNVSLSDVAAMGGRPLYSFMSIALPDDISQEWIEEFFIGYRTASERFNVALMGGDTCRSKCGVTVNILVVGEVARAHVKYRSGARVGDRIFVTGCLGDSAAGLKALIEGVDAPELIREHHNPTPHLAEGAWLGQQSGVGAMMDISDGVGSDLRHILKASGVGATVELDAIPISLEVLSAADKNRWNAMELALSGGEDYKLLLTINNTDSEAIKNGYLKCFGKCLYEIGVITEDAEDSIIWLRDGVKMTTDFKGFTHF